ncbi:MAG: flavodoxin-dependent (E)-4-hydroxy-3-methylbut-2-enyl-diphosphate synthase [Phycisphaerae bacterium]|nr:flavodoxin-dependent (E)-4-hydroxy-3-methylbut-2-enyl-diphosphate synthase [Phycisphaerae bacterium]MDD5381600.1 flavodoxin-dependent (E)-4-hydroxy-3-methylbut-2-enyl-diphosphate synthase [Phycisphaerae bacterium]
MIKRRKTRTISIGRVSIGSSAPIVIQSMTKVPTIDVASAVMQINQLVRAGCRLVRIAVPTRADTAAFAKIVQKVSVPLIADVHFSAERAIEAIEAGAAKIRLNPGNIKKCESIHRIIDAAKMHKTAVRIGVNEASIRNLKTKDVPPRKRTALMLKEMKKYVRLFENRSFTQLVLSAKSSDPLRTIEINRRIAETFDYPIHLGLTHAGLPEDAQIPSAIALGTLLAEGIGDTIRVSAAGNPVVETKIAKEILIALGLHERQAPELIVCPTCARAQIDVVRLARRVKKILTGIDKPLRIAVMGCIVNGPGEAADADLAVCAAKNKAYLYKNGKKIAVVPESKILPALLKKLQNL